MPLPCVPNNAVPSVYAQRYQLAQHWFGADGRKRDHQAVLVDAVRRRSGNLAVDTGKYRNCIGEHCARLMSFILRRSTEMRDIRKFIICTPIEIQNIGPLVFTRGDYRRCASRAFVPTIRSSCQPARSPAFWPDWRRFNQPLSSVSCPRPALERSPAQFTARPPLGGVELKMRAAILEKPADVSSRPLRITEIDIPATTSEPCCCECSHVESAVQTSTSLKVSTATVGQRHSRTSNRRRSCTGTLWRNPAGIACRRFMAWRYRRCLLLLQERPGKPLRQAQLYGVYSQRRVCGVHQARSDFVHPIPAALESTQAAPLLCAGIIGFRSLRVADVQRGEKVGLFGFGASAHLALPVLRSWDCQVYVSTRGPRRQRLAERLIRGVGRR